METLVSSGCPVSSTSPGKSTQLVGGTAWTPWDSCEGDGHSDGWTHDLRQVNQLSVGN